MTRHPPSADQGLKVADYLEASVADCSSVGLVVGFVVQPEVVLYWPGRAPMASAHTAWAALDLQREIP